MIRQKLLITLLSFVMLSGYSQLSIDDIDLSKISQRKIRDYIDMQRERNVQLLSDFKASCREGKEIPGWYSMKNTYLVKADPDALWKIYLNTNFSEAWEGKMVSFGLLFSKWTDFVCYRNESYTSAVDTGQVFFINLRIMNGFVNLPVGIEVVNVDEENHQIVFSYLEGNNAQGEQRIQLRATPEGYTEVIHIANFKSESDFRDKHLYPVFHTKALNEFHRKMANKLITDSDSFIVVPE